MPYKMSSEDEEIVAACANLVGRTGAKSFELAYLHEDVPVEQAGWYALAQLQGARISVEDQPGPVAAAKALAERILEGAKCRCGRLVALSPEGAVAFNATMADGSEWTVEQAAEAGQCLWQRVGPRWEMGCQ